MNKKVKFLLAFSGFFLLFLFPLSGFAVIDPNNIDISTLKSGIFTPVLTDRSINYLGQLFGGMGNVLRGSGGQLLSYVFVVFNLAIWVIAGVYVVYTSVSSVLNAAHEGEFMGKKMHSMVPVRVVAGVAALLPKFSGYSFIQLAVMWVIVQGVGLAGNIWGAAIDFFQGGGAVYQRHNPNETGSPYQADYLPNTLKSMKEILNAEICMYTLQKAAIAEVPTAGQTKPPPSQGWWVQPATATENGIISFGNDTNHTLCGSFSYAKTKEIPVNTVVSDLMGLAYSLVYAQKNTSSTLVLPECLVYQSGNPVSIDSEIIAGKVCPQSNALVLEMANYLSIMSAAKQQERIEQAAGGTATTGDDFKDAKAEGWILAGKYYQRMIKANMGTKQNLLSQDDYTVATTTQSAPHATSLGSELQKNLNNSFKGILTNILTLVEGNYWLGPGGYFHQAEIIANQLYPSALSSNQQNQDIKSKIEQLKNKYMKQQINPLLKNNRIDQDVFNLMQSPVNAWFDTILKPNSKNINYQDPVARARAMGISMIEAANKFWSDATQDAFMILGVSAGVSTAALFILAVACGFLDMLAGSRGANIMAASNTVAQFAFQIVMARIFWYLPLGIALSTPIFVLGATLAVYIPLIPFMLFMFAALGWFIAVVEAMVAAPLVALGITHPEGHDLLGKAEQSIMLLLGVFLKPALIVTGLLAGIILTFISANLLDAGFFPLMYDQLMDGSGTGGAQFVVIIGMLLLYTMAMMAIVDQCFSLIYVLSDKTLRWIGGHPEQSAEGGMLQQVKSGYEGKVGEGAQGGGQMVSAMKSSGMTIQAAPPFERKEKAGGDAANASVPAAGGAGGGGAGNDGGGNSNITGPLAMAAERKKSAPPTTPSAPPGSPSTPPPSASPATPPASGDTGAASGGDDDLTMLK